jgi:hypothetical protein
MEFRPSNNINDARWGAIWISYECFGLCTLYSGKENEVIMSKIMI